MYNRTFWSAPSYHWRAFIFKLHQSWFPVNADLGITGSKMRSKGRRVSTRSHLLTVTWRRNWRLSQDSDVVNNFQLTSSRSNIGWLGKVDTTDNVRHWIINSQRSVYETNWELDSPSFACKQYIFRRKKVLKKYSLKSFTIAFVK